MSDILVIIFTIWAMIILSILTWILLKFIAYIIKDLTEDESERRNEDD